MHINIMSILIISIKLNYSLYNLRDLNLINRKFLSIYFLFKIKFYYIIN